MAEDKPDQSKFTTKPLVRLQDVLHNSKYFQKIVHELMNLLQPTFYCLEFIVKILVHGADGSGKRLLVKTVAEKLKLKFVEARVADLFDENIVGTEKKIKACLASLSSSAPCLIYLSGYELFCKLESQELERVRTSICEFFEELAVSNLSQPIVFIGSTTDYDVVFKTPLSGMFHHGLGISAPALDEAVEILEFCKKHYEFDYNSHDLLKEIQNNDYYIGNLMHLINKSQTGAVDSDTVSKVIGEEVRWADVGGLGGVKQEIIDTIQLSIDYPELKESGLRRTGILLYGPPGTGKTLLARAVASECSLNFINVKGPELLNEYVGQSEENIRRLFQRARESRPSVIFFDELDSLAPNRGQAGDSGGVMDRMVSQLLAEMDGINKSDDLFVIGATNRVELVDSSLLRPGRFDKVLEVPLPKSRESRLQILEALTRKMNLAANVDLEAIEKLAPASMSGADFQGLCLTAVQLTFDRCIGLVESGKETEDSVPMETTMEDFTESVQGIRSYV